MNQPTFLEDAQKPPPFALALALAPALAGASGRPAALSFTPVTFARRAALRHDEVYDDDDENGEDEEQKRLVHDVLYCNVM